MQLQDLIGTRTEIIRRITARAGAAWIVIVLQGNLHAPLWFSPHTAARRTARRWLPPSCRKRAEVVNRQFAERGVSVGRTHVATTLRDATADIVSPRRTFKHRVPKAMSRNRVWALDLTGKADLSEHEQMVFGLLDHGTRACLRLSPLTDKRSVTILLELIVAFRRFGLPKRLRMDNDAQGCASAASAGDGMDAGGRATQGAVAGNAGAAEACFNSRLMRSGLALIDIRLQTTELHCPWQNGSIERFFGTFKQCLDRIVITDTDDLRRKLIEFRAWYNHVRTHHRSFSSRTGILAFLYNDTVGASGAEKPIERPMGNWPRVNLNYQTNCMFIASCTLPELPLPFRRLNPMKPICKRPSLDCVQRSSLLNRHRPPPL